MEIINTILTQLRTTLGVVINRVRWHANDTDESRCAGLYPGDPLTLLSRY